jgi:hypothetical protein
MKIKEILASTYELVERYKSSGFIAIPIKSPDYFTSRLIIIEQNLAWKKLVGLFNNASGPATAENLMAFTNLLAERWQRIKDIYQLNYTRTYRDPLAIVYTALARELALHSAGQQPHYLELLMPSINIRNDVLLMDLHDLDELAEKSSIDTISDRLRQVYVLDRKAPMPDDLLNIAHMEGIKLAEKDKIQLNHFFLDRWGNVINIKDALENAINDDIIKHTSILETATDDAGRVLGFAITLMSRAMRRNTRVPKDGFVCVNFKKDHFEYIVAGMHTRDVITATELNIFTRPLSLKVLNQFHCEILELIASRGHVNLPKRSRPLATNELHRIIYHSKQSNALYQSVTTLNQEKGNAFNAVRAIEILIEDLKDGGKSRLKGGTDATSGNSSYIGVRKFYDFTQSLTVEDFNKLFEASVDYGAQMFYWPIVTIKMLWSELLATSLDRAECNFTDDEKIGINIFIDPYFSKVRDEAEKIHQINLEIAAGRRQKRVERPLLCSEEFARMLGDILECNPQLIEIIPELYLDNPNYLNEFKDNLAKLENNVAQSKAALKIATQEGELIHYYEGVVDALHDPICAKSFSQSIASSVENLIFLLGGFAPEQQEYVVTELITQPFLENLLNTPAKVTKFFNQVAARNGMDLDVTAGAVLQTIKSDVLTKLNGDERTLLKFILPSKLYIKYVLPCASQKMSLGFLKPAQKQEQLVVAKQLSSCSPSLLR